MTEFEYEENKVVGYVDFPPGASIARIEVVGYTDWKNQFYKLKESDAQKLFPPFGKVFAHNFADKHYDTKGTLVCISVKPNVNIDEKHDAFIWDKSGGAYEFGARVKKMKTAFTANGQFNYTVLKENNLLDVDHDTYITSGGSIYLIKAGSQDRLISYWKEGTLDTITVNGKLFITNNVKGGEDGKIDITTDEQLLEWYMKNVLKKNWGQIFEEKTFRNVEPLLRDAFSVSNGLDGLVLASRIKRLTHINRALTLSFEQIEELKSLPWLKDSIEKSIIQLKDAYLEEVESEKASELQEIRDKYEMEILVEKEKAELAKKKLIEEIDGLTDKYKNKQSEQEKLLEDKKIEADLIDDSINKKKSSLASLDASINRLENRKEQIISDFSIIKEVLGGNGNPQSQRHSNKKIAIEEVKLSDEPVPVFQAFVKSLENTLKANMLVHSTATELAHQLAFYKVLLVPDIAIAKVFAIACMKSQYTIEYVSATWKSFDDLWENGLGQIVQECNKNENIMHFLFLENINLNYLPNYMMPLIDIQNKVTSSFPGYDVRYPDNLRIICTIDNGEVMPLATNCMKHIGCVDKIIEKKYYGWIEAPNDIIGYLTPNILNSEKVSVKNAPNYYAVYLNNE